MSYNDAISYTQSHPQPDAVSCLRNPNNRYHYVQEPGSSIVLEVKIKSIAFRTIHLISRLP